jgi:predicted metalloprotease with PDZ domain
MNNKISSFFVALILSIVLHFFVVISRYKKYEVPNKNQEQHQNQNKGGGADKEEETTSKIWFSSGVIPCDAYEGIGVQFMALTGIITHVAHDSPAWKAGLRAGDEFITPIWNMNLKFGQNIEVAVKRSGKTLKFNILVDRICKE